MLLAAPAGAGKTALVRTWSAEQPSAHFRDLGCTAAPVPSSVTPPGAHGLVVVDNVQHASAPQLDEIIGLLAAPAGPRLALAGRWIPPRLRTAAAATGTKVIGESALALTETETAQVCARYGSLPPDVVAEVFAVTGGWAAGVVIAATSMAGDPVGTEHHLQELLVTAPTLHDYVVGDVLVHLSDEDRRAVYETSTVETVCAALFTALTGRADAAHLLRKLARDAMFAVHVGVRGWYQYRRLWRIALYSHMQRHEPGRLRTLHSIASHWYAAHGRYREAVHHAAAAQDHARAAELADRYHVDIVAAGAQVALTPGPPHTWVAPIAVSGAQERHAARRPAAAAAAAPDAAHLDAGRLEERAATVILALHDDRPSEARAAVAGWLRAAQKLGPAPYARALRHSATAALRLDNLDTAAHEASLARRILQDHGVAGAHDDGWARIVLAAVHVQRDELDAATDQLSDLAVDLWHVDGPLNTAENLLRAMIEQQRGHAQAALHTTYRLIHTDTPPPGLHLLHAQLLLANGYRTDAERHAATHAADITVPARRLLDAELLLARGHAARAAAALQPFVQHAGEPVPHRIDALLLLAEAAAQTGDRQHAVNLRSLARCLAVPAGIRRPFLLDRLRGGGTHDATPTGTVPAVTRRSTAPAARLTDAELAVLAQLDSLLTVVEIGARLHLTANTVKSHISSLYRKLDVHRRRDAVRKAADLGLL
ncbi:LuxR C-terminal-related transcriptional regulator [Dactylosporangium sp. NBC_01737]|uniref:LuxR C-terminal-related transcriptional regulator n=1 Tax=Dactylosporangium sp. NBC_01737 TaxID=2975959 RepID=UPI002E1045C3|nr:LuxR C-terminal-related transcriptional regulator [Dactylosporangium sp. NBC_01737]